MAAAGFHLDEHDRAAIDGHKIQFAQATSLASRHDLVAQPADVPFGYTFATTIERLVSIPRRE